MACWTSSPNRVQRRAGVRVAALLEALGSEREPNPKSGQALLNSVVEVSLDALTIGVTGSEHAARQPRREYPRQRLQQERRAVGRRAPPRAARSSPTETLIRAPDRPPRSPSGP